MERVTAVFDDHGKAEEAVNELRRLGVKDDQIGIVAPHKSDTFGKDNGSSAGEKAGDAAEGAGMGALAGAGVGALFGLAAAAIAGPVGPLVTAGFLYPALGAYGGGAVAGAAVGGTAGAVSGGLARTGYSQDEADYYADEVERGAVLVAVETKDATTAERVRTVLMQHAGRTWSNVGVA